MQIADAQKRKKEEKERKRKKMRESRREDVELFYSYKILRDTYIASPLAMPSRFTHFILLLMHMNTGAAFSSLTPVIDIAQRIQKRTKSLGEEKQRIYVEKSQRRNKTISTFSPLNIRAHRGRALRDRRSASGVRNNTRRGTRTRTGTRV